MIPTVAIVKRKTNAETGTIITISYMTEQAVICVINRVLIKKKKEKKKKKKKELIVWLVWCVTHINHIVNSIFAVVTRQRLLDYKLRSTNS